MKKLFFLLAVVVATAVSAMAQSRTVSGVVVDSATDDPLVGATVQPVGGGSGAATDLDGRFTLTIPSTVKQVKVSYVGYNTKTVAVSDKMFIGLETNDNSLDEVIVTGYGSGKKIGSLVGSVSVVGEKVLEDTPSTTFVDALQGQVPGLAIFSNSGEPSESPSSIRIRGVNSLNASQDPLYILDGAPVTSAIFTTLNPSDIESISILKDASSTAIYGSRAANGVIVITSKKGRYGDKAKVTIRANAGWSERAENRIHLMNSEQYIEFRDKINTPVSQEVRDLVSNYGISTDWSKELIKDKALLYSMEARVQGGSDKTRYYLSFGHYDQDGVIILSGIRRETLSTNIDTKVNDWFQVGLNGNMGYEAYESNGNATGRYSSNPFSASYALLPYDTPYYYSFDENGNIVRGEEAKYYHYSQMYNPNWLSQVLSNSKRTNVTAMLNLYEQITPLKGLTIRAQQAMNAFDYRNEAVRNSIGVIDTPMGDYVTSLSNYSGRTSEAFQRWYQFTYTNTAEYKFDLLKKHFFTFLLGQESIITKNSNFAVASTGQPDAYQWLLTEGTDVTISNLTHSQYRTVMNSYFFNINYDFDSRYFFDFNLRRDGSSKFAPGHRWATFFAVGGMWNAKNEAFLQDVKWLDDLKVRVNYGTTGNSGIGNYAWQGSAASGSVYNGGSSLALSSASNNDLTWETVRAFDLGFDLGVFDRIRTTVDFYRKSTINMLMEIPYSYTTGFSSNYANVGSMRNTGVDFQISGDLFKNKDWFVGLSVNFGYNKNIITELFNGLEEYTISGTGRTLKIGEDPYNLYTVRYAGVDPRDGQQMWYDKNGNLTKVYNEEEDQVSSGHSMIAPWNGGFGLNARWKNLSLRADFNWSAKKYIINSTYWYIKTASICAAQNGSVDLLNVWTQPGDVTDIPNLVDLYGQSQEVQPDSRMLENSSFLRLKNLTVNYSLPTKWISKAKLSDVSIHFTARNLFTITKFTGIDPEYEGNAVHFMYPNTRNYEFGVEVSF